MWIGDKLGSAASRWALIFALGLGIGMYKGCDYGEKRAYKRVIEEQNKAILVYEKQDNRFYRTSLEQVNEMIKDSHLEKIVKK